MWWGVVPSVQAGGAPFAGPRIEPGEVRWAGADAFGRWSVVAGARRASGDDAEFDPAFALPLDPSLKRRAIAAEATSGRLALDAVRSLGFGERLDLHVGARRAGLALREDTAESGGSLDERASTRAVRSQVDATMAWSRPGRWGPFAWTRSLTLRLASDTQDVRRVLDSGWTGARSVVRRDGAGEQRISLEGRQSFDLLRDVGFEGAMRLERHRLKADPADEANAFLQDTRLSTRAELRWTPAAAIAFFARTSRGAEDASSSWLARDPFRGGVAVAADPASLARGSDFGGRWAAGALDLGVTAWRRDLPFSLGYSEGGTIVSALPSSRHGLAATLSWRPATRLAIDAAFFLDRSRVSDRPALPGAPQVFGSAGATMRMTRDWDAKLRVNYLGPREAIEEAPSLKSTTLANLELVRWFGRTTRISLDVFNVFNQRPVAVDGLAAARMGLADGTGDSFLSSPAEPRAFLLKFRTRF